MSIAEQIGDRRLFEECVVFLAHVLYMQGDLLGSLAESERALKSARERGDVQTQQMALLAQSRALYFLGRNDQCVAALSEVGASFDAVGDGAVVLSTRIVYQSLVRALPRVAPASRATLSAR